MKKLILLTLLTFLFSKESSAARLKLPYCSNCQYVEQVADLPDSADFYSEEYKSFVDVGYLYSQFWVLWLPIWNSDGKYVLNIKGQDVFYEVSAEDLENYKKAYNLDLPENPISIWNKLGGKAIVALIIVGGIWASIGKNKPAGKKEEFFTAKA